MSDTGRILTITAVLLLALATCATISAGIYQAFSAEDTLPHIFRWLVFTPLILSSIPTLGLILLAACERPR